MIKLLLEGSPCTYWSVCRPNDRETVSSGFGWELFLNCQIAKETFMPDLYLYENVASMSKDIRNEISKSFNIQPLQINGGLVSAAERDRLYWTNIKGITQPLDKGLVLNDIMEKNVPEKYFYNHPLKDIDMSKQVCAIMEYKALDMSKRIFNPAFKCHTLTTCGGGNTQKKVMDNGRARKLTPVEYERCMTLPDGYTKAVAETHRYTGCGNGWTADIIIHILKHANIPLNEEIVVLSMYDGIGTGRYVLDKMGYKNVKYFAYEIDKNAMVVAKSNYPDIIERGDAFQVRDKDWEVA
jgi:site-specific DNA-cytosine methylase